MDRDQKRNEVSQLKGTFTAATSAVVLGFKGLTVDKDTTFRKHVREGKGQYRVSKNTLLRLAVKETVFESLTPHFKGATAVATTEGDVVALAAAPVDPHIRIKRLMAGIEPRASGHHAIFLAQQVCAVWCIVQQRGGGIARTDVLA